MSEWEKTALQEIDQYCQKNTLEHRVSELEAHVLKLAELVERLAKQTGEVVSVLQDLGNIIK